MASVLCVWSLVSVLCALYTHRALVVGVLCSVVCVLVLSATSVVCLCALCSQSTAINALWSVLCLLSFVFVVSPLYGESIVVGVLCYVVCARGCWISSRRLVLQIPANICLASVLQNHRVFPCVLQIGVCDGCLWTRFWCSEILILSK